MPDSAPPRSLWRDLQELSAVAGGLTALALLVSGAGPGLLMTILTLAGLADGVSLLGGIVSTAPLSLTVGMLLIRTTTYRGPWSVGAVVGGLILAAWVSREAAIAFGEIGRADFALPIPNERDPLYYPKVLYATVAGFLQAYGPQRFALAIAGGVFLAYAFHRLLLPRIVRPRPVEPTGSEAGPQPRTD
jgi:hypothetical protein